MVQDKLSTLNLTLNIELDKTTASPKYKIVDTNTGVHFSCLMGAEENKEVDVVPIAKLFLLSPELLLALREIKDLIYNPKHINNITYIKEVIENIERSSSSIGVKL